MQCDGRVVLDLARGCSTGAPLVNNLGGVGPDTAAAEEVRYGGVGVYDGASFDLVVSATSPVARLADQYTDGYSGCNEQIGMIAIQSGTYVDLRFRFEDSTRCASR